MAKDDPAFSSNEKQADGRHWQSHLGLTKREYMATHIMASLLTTGVPRGTTDTGPIFAKAAVIATDALLAELAKP